MRMSSYSVQALQEKLNRLSLSQDSIETLSLWVIHHKAYARTSVSMWLDNVLKGGVMAIMGGVTPPLAITRCNFLKHLL